MIQKMFEELAIVDRSGDRKYFTMIPNLLFEQDVFPKDLTLADFKLYATIKKVAGDHGICFMTTRRLAKEANMSVGQVSVSKKILANAGLLEITTKKRTKKGRAIDHITIIDIWERNVGHFKSKKDEQCSDDCSDECSLTELEEDLLEENLLEEDAAASSSLTEQTVSTDNGFKEVFTAYVNTFGSLLSSFQAERFKDLWEDYPELEIHEVARSEMYKAMMRKQNPVAPNLNYYAKCLDTERRRNWVIVEEEEDETGKT